MSRLHFKTKLFTIGPCTILELPADISAQLPSRGQTMVQGTINGFSFSEPLEPDGNGSHWLKLDAALQRGTQAKAGSTVDVAIKASADWPEPPVPPDFQKALAAHQPAQQLWTQITPMARWEWVRWIRSTGRQETRQRRIEVACSKLNDGKRRPCCWNRNLCTDPSVSKNGVLLQPAQASVA